MGRLALFLGLLVLATGKGAGAAEVTITVDQIHSADGKVYVTLWGSRETWLDDQKSLQNIGVAAAGQINVTLHDVTPGRYAIATFHDENDNGEMDFNFIGYPEEGYAFSNDIRPFLTAPSFESCAFDVGIDDAALTIHMVYP
ncbi:MAG TPA: DUF2141 domain-containing protein [Aliidongia sp.]|uniref:DUF2141 domain-containing protein n=1 Tax=Aliidongia sp. TaxID=1914230 RepID=UPI002DDDA367|nr:DUF2141 domain-containing protein [Aliidongia sp.]HEV2674492.1 DUF2141 domain-containing protein [Aliidongia sp.]